MRKQEYLQAKVREFTRLTGIEAHDQIFEGTHVISTFDKYVLATGTYRQVLDCINAILAYLRYRPK